MKKIILTLLAAFLIAAPAAAEPSMGIYALMNERYNRNSLPPYATSDNGGYTATPQGFSSQYAGVGLRYTTLKFLMFDLSGASMTNDPIYATAKSTIGTRDYGRFDKDYFVRLTANFVSPSLLGFRAIIGAGLAKYKLDSYGFTHSKGITPEARAGVEYRPIRWLGLAVFDNCDLTSVTNGQDYTLNKNSLEATLAFYF